MVRGWGGHEEDDRRDKNFFSGAGRGDFAPTWSILERVSPGNTKRRLSSPSYCNLAMLATWRAWSTPSRLTIDMAQMMHPHG